MPLFKGSGHKSKPNKAVAYVTDKNKAVIISSQAMDDTKDYATQFRETNKLFGKGSRYKERKYYHFKLSCGPADNVDPEVSHQLAQELAEKLFPNHECVIATHNDTDVIHSHIIINSVNFETGLKLHLNDNKYADCKDMANTLAEKKGLSTLDWRTLAKENRANNREGINANSPKLISNAERQISKRAALETDSWKEALRLAIDEAKSHCQDRASFESYLKNNYGVEMPRNTGKTVSFMHPAIDKPIRGVKLGGDYTADSIDQALKNNYERSLLNAKLLSPENAQSFRQQPTNAITGNATAESAKPISTVGKHEPTIQDGNGKRPVARSVSDVQRELRAIDTTVQSLTGRNSKNPTADRAESASGQQEIFSTDNVITDGSKSNVDSRTEATVKPRKKSRGYDR